MSLGSFEKTSHWFLNTSWTFFLCSSVKSGKSTISWHFSLEFNSVSWLILSTLIYFLKITGLVAETFCTVPKMSPFFITISLLDGLTTVIKIWGVLPLLKFSYDSLIFKISLIFGSKKGWNKTDYCFESNSIFSLHFTLNVLFPGTIVCFGTRTSHNKSGASATFCNIAIMVSAPCN